MAEARVPNPLVAQFRRGGIPKDLRLIAAQGALPLKPEDLVELLHLLLSDREEVVRNAAADSLAARPVEELLPLFKDRSTPPQVLAWGLVQRAERDLREAILQNVSTPDDIIEQMAPALPEQLAELVVINQVRLLRRTSLLEALESNPDLNNDQRRRLRELRETFKVGEQLAGAGVPAAAQAEAEAPEEEPPGPIEEAGPISEDEALVRYLGEDERRQPEKVSVVQRLYRLDTAEKVITALKGTREERAVLIRDPNRIVATAVLGSPRISESEIESFAAMKSVSDQILREIGTHREWTKRYGVISGLVRNPRTPVGVALTMVPRLNARDMKSVAVDRNVPEVIRKHAQRFVRAVQAGPAGRKG
jgi:hypothetical protein